MDCLNCFGPPSPLRNPRHRRVSTVRAPRYNTRAVTTYTHERVKVAKGGGESGAGAAAYDALRRPPTPYPHREGFSGGLPRPRRANIRTHMQYVRRYTIDGTTELQHWRSQHTPEEPRHPSVRDHEPGNLEIRVPPQQRQSDPSEDRWSTELRERIAAQNDRIRNRVIPVHKSVAPPEVFRSTELRRRNTTRDDKFGKRPLPILKRGLADLPIAFSDLQLSPGRRFNGTTL
jgi:hypothetical protein